MDSQMFAEEHKKFLEENAPDVLSKQSNQKNYLSSVGEQATEMFDNLMMQYNNSPEIQKLPYQERVMALQSRRHEAEEIVRHDLIYQPLKDE